MFPSEDHHATGAASRSRRCCTQAQADLFEKIPIDETPFELLHLRRARRPQATWTTNDRVLIAHWARRRANTRVGIACSIATADDVLLGYDEHDVRLGRAIRETANAPDHPARPSEVRAAEALLKQMSQITGTRDPGPGQASRS